MIVTVAAAAEVRADTASWTLCTPGAFRSCNSVSIITTPIIEGSVRTGTIMTIQVANLAGSPGYTSDPWSALTGVGFVRNAPLSFGTYANSTGGWVYGQPSGGAVGYPIGTNYAVYESWVPQFIFPLYFPQIEGCALVHFTAYTCGAGAYISFTFETNAIFDAGEISSTFIRTRVATQVPNNPAYGTTELWCWTDPSQLNPPNPPGNPACDIVPATSTVPEPVTMALLGTGLLGVGAARRRKRQADH